MGLQKLFEKEKVKRLRAGTKLTYRHICYKNEKMNDRLAAQVLSDGVGDALMYVKSTDPNFERCEATSKFCKMLIDAFDILNIRRLYSTKPYNGAISKFCAYVEDLKFENGI